MTLPKEHPTVSLLYFTANPNSESEIVTVTLSPFTKARKQVFDFDFGTLTVKGPVSTRQYPVPLPGKKCQVQAERPINPGRTPYMV